MNVDWRRAIQSLSIAILALFYGIAAAYTGLFPSKFVDQALRQARQLVAPPQFLNPRIYDRQGARIVSPERMEPGLTLITGSVIESGERIAMRLIDAQGNTVHAWRLGSQVLGSSPSDADRDVHGFALLDDGDVVANIRYGVTVRLDGCGNVIWRLDTRGTHHAVGMTDDGEHWIPLISYTEHATSGQHPDGFPGLPGPVYQEELIRVSAEGRIVERFNLFDVLYQNGLQRYIPKHQGRIVRHTGELVFDAELLHLNDVEVLSGSMAEEYEHFDTGDLLLSFRFLDLVMVVDPDSLTVKWHLAEPFIHQHDPDYIGDGWIGVFDNNQDGSRRGSMLGGSRIIAMRPFTDSMQVLFPTSESEPFYTPALGSWQKLDNGNLLLTESQAGRVVEVAPDGSTVWEWVSPPYDPDNVPEITGAHRYSLSASDVSDWPCSAVVTGMRGSAQAP